MTRDKPSMPGGSYWLYGVEGPRARRRWAVGRNRPYRRNRWVLALIVAGIVVLGLIWIGGW